MGRGDRRWARSIGDGISEKWDEMRFGIDDTIMYSLRAIVVVSVGWTSY